MFESPRARKAKPLLRPGSFSGGTLLGLAVCRWNDPREPFPSE